jgi:uncharacterized protein YdeI (YjbR/CyaY-like superfamily)
MEETEELYMTNRSSWRSWLEKNHDRKKEAWLIFYKKHTGKSSIAYGDAVEEALCFGWIDSIVKKIDDEKFARKFTPRKPGSKWSESNKKRADKMITQGKMTGAGLELVNEAKKRGEWSTASLSRNSKAIPAYIEEAIRSNEKASGNFRKLALSYKRQYVGWVDSAVKEDTRKRRLAEVIRVLERNEKLGMK